MASLLMTLDHMRCDLDSNSIELSEQLQYGPKFFFIKWSIQRSMSYIFGVVFRDMDGS